MRVVITDTTVERLYPEIATLGDLVIAVPPGEASKSREMKAEIEDRMLDRGAGRDAVVIGVGGGVVTDLAGFVAATFCRGVRYIAMPTTLLGMVDAAIGGKVGINTRHGKNTIGAFYPAEVQLEMRFLETLPEREMRSGMAEVIKYALILDRELFESLESGSYDLEAVIRRCIAHKERVVAKDAKETGYRRILNFGHTVGHAVERVTGYALTHGEAVAIGMAEEARRSERLLPDEHKRICALLESFGFSLALPEGDLKSAMRFDKKTAGEQVRFVPLLAIGEVDPCCGEYCCAY